MATEHVARLAPLAASAHSTPIRRAPAWLKPFTVLLARPLELNIGSQRLRFESVSDFEFALAGRTAVAGAKFRELCRSTISDLRREAAGIKETEHRLVILLERTLNGAGGLTGRLRPLGHQIYSKDHSWREIFDHLNGLGSAYDNYKRAALAKYLQYLASRSSLVQFVLCLIDEDRSARDSRSDGVPDASGMRETQIYDVQHLMAAHRRESKLRRLPRGEDVTLQVSRSAPMDLVLSDHRFRLFAGRPLTLLDDRGKVYAVPEHSSTMGRDLSNDIVVDTAHRTVSRKHLIIEPLGVDRARITDLSSHGTYVPAEVIVSVR